MRGPARVLVSVPLAAVAAAALVVGTAAANGDRLTPLKTKPAATDPQVRRLRADLVEQERLAGALATAAIRQRLSGQAVVLVVASDVPATDVARTQAALADAGANIAAGIGLLASFFDPMQDSLAGALADQLAHAAKLRLPAGSGVERSDALLAAALSARSRYAADAATVLAAFQQAGLLSVTGTQPRAGGCLLVLLPATGRLPGLDQLLADFAHAGIPVVAATPRYTPAGPLAAARSDPTLAAHLSTLDSLATPTGPQAAVLALTAAVAGRFGDYGTGPGTTGPVPTG